MENNSTSTQGTGLSLQYQNSFYDFLLHSYFAQQKALTGDPQNWLDLNFHQDFLFI